jgi:hypothetical protein
VTHEKRIVSCSVNTAGCQYVTRYQPRNIAHSGIVQRQKNICPCISLSIRHINTLVGKYTRGIQDRTQKSYSSITQKFNPTNLVQKAKVVPVLNYHHAVQTYGEAEVKFHEFFTSALGGNEWSVSHGVT